MELIIIWIVSIIITTWIANKKKQGIAGFFCGMFFGPLGIVIALASSSKKISGNKKKNNINNRQSAEPDSSKNIYEIIQSDKSVKDDGKNKIEFPNEYTFSEYNFVLPEPGTKEFIKMRNDFLNKGSIIIKDLNKSEISHKNTSIWGSFKNISNNKRKIF